LILSFEFFNPALALGDVCSYAIPAEVWMKKWLMGECAGCVVGFFVAHKWRMLFVQSAMEYSGMKLLYIPFSCSNVALLTDHRC